MSNGNKNISWFTVVFVFVFSFFVGVPQAIADVTQSSNLSASRTNSTVYQNTTGYPLFITATFSPDIGGDCTLFSSSVNSLTTAVAELAVSVSADIRPVTIVIPNLYYYGYSGTGCGKVYWFEWALANVDSGGGSGIASTTTVVNNPTVDLFAGMVCLFVGFFGTIWFFRRPRI